MRRLEITVVLVLCCTFQATSEEAPPRNQSHDKLIKFPDKIVERKSTAYTQPNAEEENRTFMSQIASWIFPFANWQEKSSKTLEPIASASHNQYQPLYPPFQQTQQQKEHCNPCNKEPWIPMATNYGQNTIINFVKPSELNGGGLVPQATAYPGHPGRSPSINYNSPKLPLAVSYGLPKPPLQNYRGPPSSGGLPSHHRFKSPPAHILMPAAGKGHGPPIPLTYFSPPPMTLGVPIKSFGPPPNLIPPKPLSTEIYPNVQYGPPAPVALPAENDQTPIDMKPPAPPLQPQNPHRHNPLPQLALTFMPPPPPPHLHQQQPTYASPDIPPLPMSQTNFLLGSGQGGSASGPGGLETVPSRVVPLPQLHPAPLPPLHNAQNFHSQNLPAASNIGHVELIPSVRIADYLSSVQHPISVVQSPLVDIVSPGSTGAPQSKFNDNPIVVLNDDTHTAAATLNNRTYEERTTPASSNQKPHVSSITINTPSTLTNYPSSTFPTQPSQSANVRPSISAAFTENNIGVDFINQLLTNPNAFHKDGKVAYTQPPIDYSNWTPKLETVAEGISVPSDLKESVWLTATGNGEQITEPNKRPKQIQIVIPYKTTVSPNFNTQSASPNNYNYHPLATHRPTVAIVTEPSIKQPVWINYTNSKAEGSEYVTAIAATPKPFSNIVNIKDLLKEEVMKDKVTTKLPFDVLRLQKNIDDWTQQEFSRWITKGSTSGKLVPSKKIPNEYLTTLPYSNNTDESTEKNTLEHVFDHEVAGSLKKESKIGNKENEIDDLFIPEFTPNSPTTTEEFTTESSTTEEFTTFAPTTITLNEYGSTPTHTPKWNSAQVSISPDTKEKIYVVTPQPWNVVPEEINEKLISTKSPETKKMAPNQFSVVVQHEKDNGTDDSLNDVKSDLKVIFSEWPHIINNLVTTTTTERAKTTRHPLLGLMDLSSYTPPANATVQTYSGHSRVITVVTPSSALRKRNTDALHNTSTIVATSSSVEGTSVKPT